MTQKNKKQLQQKTQRLPIQKVVQDVWAYILGYYQDNGYMPTLEEIGREFDKTKQWADLCLAELEKQGKIKVIPNKHRGIQLI